MAWRTKSTSWAKKMKKKTKKLNELSLLQGEEMGRAGALVPEEQIVGVHSNFPITPPPTYRKALYMGRYQQTKEQGVKRRIQRIDSPKPVPLLVSTQKLARQARKFRRRARVLPNRGRDRMMALPTAVKAPSPVSPPGAPHQLWQRRKRRQHPPLQSPQQGRQNEQISIMSNQPPLERQLKDPEHIRA